MARLILTQILVGDDRVHASFDSYTPPHSSSQVSAPRSKSSAIISINSVRDFAMSSRRASSCHIVITWPLMPPSAGSMSTHKWLPPPSPQNGIHRKRHHSSPLIGPQGSQLWFSGLSCVRYRSSQIFHSSAMRSAENNSH